MGKSDLIQAGSIKDKSSLASQDALEVMGETE